MELGLGLNLSPKVSSSNSWLLSHTKIYKYLVQLLVFQAEMSDKSFWCFSFWSENRHASIASSIDKKTESFPMTSMNFDSIILSITPILGFINFICKKKKKKVINSVFFNYFNKISKDWCHLIIRGYLNRFCFQNSEYFSKCGNSCHVYCWNSYA